MLAQACQALASWGSAEALPDGFSVSANERWLAHVPPARVHVVTVLPASSGVAVLVGRFSEALGVDTRSWAAHKAVRKPSVDMIQGELVRRLNEVRAALLDHRA